MSSIPERQIRCPQCKKDTIYSLDNPFRPFCSERCRLIDLGEWADESFRVPTEDTENPQNQHPSQDEEE